MMELIKENLRLTGQALVMLVQAWVELLRTAALRVYGAYRGADWRTLVYLAGCLLISFGGFSDWIGYSVQFDTVEEITFGSDNRLFFFLAGPIGLFLYALGPNYRQPIMIGALILVAGLFVVGIIYPGFVHTNMVDVSEYHFRILPMGVYVIGIASVALTVQVALAKPLTTPGIIRAYIFEAPVKPKTATGKNRVRTNLR